MKLGRKYLEARAKQELYKIIYSGNNPNLPKDKLIEQIKQKFPNVEHTCPFCREKYPSLDEYVQHLIALHGGVF